MENESALEAVEPGIAERPMLGIGLTLLSCAVLRFHDVFTKKMSVFYPVGEILFFRAIGGLILLLPIALYLVRGQWKSEHPVLLTLRAVLILASMGCYVVAFRNAPIADVIAISLFSPVILSLLAIILFGEKVGLHRGGAIAVGLGAALIIANPSGEIYTPGTPWAFAGATLYAVVLLISKKAAGRDHPLLIQLYGVVIAAAVVPFWDGFSWGWPQSASHWSMLLGHGMLSAIGHTVLIFALRHAPASTVAPYTYSGVLFSAMYGVVFFGDVPGMTVLFGGGMLAASGLYIWYRERQNARRQRHA